MPKDERERHLAPFRRSVQKLEAEAPGNPYKSLTPHVFLEKLASLENCEERLCACQMHTRQASPSSLEVAFGAHGVPMGPNRPEAYALRTEIIYHSTPYN